jgi:hypothetical protein
MNKEEQIQAFEELINEAKQIETDGSFDYYIKRAEAALDELKK